MSYYDKRCGHCNQGCEYQCPCDEHMGPVARPITRDDQTGLYSNGSAGQSAIPSLTLPIYVTLTTPTQLEYRIYDGTSWSTGAVTSAVVDAVGNWWDILEPPSNIVQVNATVSGAVAESWTTPIQSERDASSKFTVAGLIGTQPTLVLYSQSLATLATVDLPGTPTHISYIDGYCVVSGVDITGNYYIVVYSTSSNTFTLLATYTYDVEVTSLYLVSVLLTGCNGSRAHTLLFISTADYILPGEVATKSTTISSTLALAPPGNVIVYDIPTYTYPSYVTKKPLLIWSTRVIGGVDAITYSENKSTIFGSSSGAVIAWYMSWYDNAATVRMTPFVLPSYDNPSLSVVEDISGLTYLLVMGTDNVTIYTITLTPLI